MKNIFGIMPTISLLFFSCGNKSTTQVKDIFPRYELSGTDTVNRIDENGLKQGHWIVFEVGPTNTGISFTHSADSTQHNASWQGSSGRTKVEEGFYINDKKKGFWKKFNADGSVKDSVESN